jgi:hypothetical protein
LNELIGAEITNIYIVTANDLDTDMDRDEYYLSLSYIRIDIEFNNRNNLSVFLCNDHNGYYPHDCVINWSVYINGILETASLNREI